MARLGDVCTVVSGTTPKTSNPDFWDGDLNWITPAELSEDTVVVCESKRKITLKGVQSCGLSPIPAGAVILSSRAPIGKTAIAGTEMYCNQGFKNLICSESIFNKYLFWFLRCNTEYLNSLGRGATFKEISKAIVEDIDIPLPDLPTQRRIAATLDKVSGGIALCKQMLADLDELVKSQFVEMFGDPASNPKKWPIMSLKDVCTKLTDGTHFSPEAFPTGQYKYITAKNIKADGFDFSNVTYLPENIHRSIYTRCNPEKGDVLYIKDGATTGIAMINTLDEEFSLLSSVALLKYNRSLLTGEYLKALMNYPTFYRQMRLNMGGAAITRLTVKKICDTDIMVAPLEQQIRFAEFAEQSDKSKLAVQQQLAELETLKKSLMQEYFG